MEPIVQSVAFVRSQSRIANDISEIEEITEKCLQELYLLYKSPKNKSYKMQAIILADRADWNLYQCMQRNATLQHKQFNLGYDIASAMIKSNVQKMLQDFLPTVQEIPSPALELLTLQYQVVKQIQKIEEIVISVQNDKSELMHLSKKASLGSNHALLFAKSCIMNKNDKFAEKAMACYAAFLDVRNEADNLIYGEEKSVRRISRYVTLNRNTIYAEDNS